MNEQKLKEAQKQRRRLLPNRIGKKVLGNEFYDKIKRIVKG